jgi:dolichol-phosphate mannosyltransferase
MKAAIFQTGNYGNNSIDGMRLDASAYFIELGYEVTVFNFPNLIKKTNKKLQMNIESNFHYSYARKQDGQISRTRHIEVKFVYSILSSLKNYDIYYFSTPDYIFSIVSGYFYREGYFPSIIIGNNIDYLHNSKIKSPNYLSNWYLKHFNMKNVLNMNVKIAVYNDREYFFYRKLGIPENSIYHINKDSESPVTSLQNIIKNKNGRSESISIVTGSINEEGNIGKWLDSIDETIKNRNLNEIREVVIVDDGSTDGTLNIIKDYQKKCMHFKIKLIERKSKMGTVNADIIGSREAEGDYIIIMDCDNQHPVEYLERLVKKYRDGYDIVVGSRYIPGSVNNWKMERQAISRVATEMAHFFFPYSNRIRDILSGYFLAKKEFITTLEPYKNMYKLLLYISIFNPKYKNYAEVPVTMVDRVSGSSKVVTNYEKTIVNYSRELVTYWKAKYKLQFLKN